MGADGLLFWLNSNYKSTGVAPQKAPTGVPGSDTWVELQLVRLQIDFQLLPGPGEMLPALVWKTSRFSFIVFS